MKRALLVGLVLGLVGGLLWPGGISISQAADPVLVGAGDIGDGLNLNLSGCLGIDSGGGNSCAGHILL